MKSFLLVLLLSLSQVSHANEILNLFSKVKEAVTTGVSAKSGCEQRLKATITVDPSIDSDLYHKEIKFDLGRKVKKAQFQGDEVSVLTEAEAQDLFELFSKIDYMKFDYLHDGCFSRAHEFALMAKENGLEMGKVFLREKDDKAVLYPESWKNNPDAPIPQGFVGWRYHVTPYVLVEKDGKLTPFVFDVGVAKKSQSLNEWKDSLMDPKSTPVEDRVVTYRDRGYVYETGRSYFPESSNIKHQLEDQEAIRELGISEFLYQREMGWR